ncbi:MAG: ATP-binding cassette domain-containing protein [Candidatus Dormibacteraceae bacterium]
MTPALQTDRLGKRFGRRWALEDTTVALPAGSVCALVGPNGAGKSTLLNLVVGLLRPTAGTIQVLGERPGTPLRELLPRLWFVAQDQPLYRDFTITEMIRFGRSTNTCWDDRLALSRLHALDVPMDRRVGSLSGGQRAQVALALALGKRPELLLLDEPLSPLDPLARRDFLATVMAAVAELGTTVVLSSHDLGDLERVSDHLVILGPARVRLDGDIGDLLLSHRRLTGPRREIGHIANVEAIVDRQESERQVSLLVRVSGPILDPRWEVQMVALEDLVLGYLSSLRGGGEPAARALELVG